MVIHRNTPPARPMRLAALCASLSPERQAWMVWLGQMGVSAEAFMVALQLAPILDFGEYRETNLRAVEAIANLPRAVFQAALRELVAVGALDRGMRVSSSRRAYSYRLVARFCSGSDGTCRTTGTTVCIGAENHHGGNRKPLTKTDE